MPPKDEPQPSSKERAEVLNWVTSKIKRGLRTVMAPSPPFHGNGVDHELLFDDAAAELPTASPQLRWRTSSPIY